MLSIGRIRNIPEQQMYYIETVAKGREDYYAGKGEAPGEWQGAAADEFGLDGDVTKEQLQDLFAGKNPATGEWLLDEKARAYRNGKRADKAVTGFDMTFSAPKSVSVMYAVGDTNVQSMLVEAHEWAVNEALQYVNDQAVRARRGHAGKGAANTIHTIHADGLLMAKFRHRTSRNLDPHLHTHVVVPNMVRGIDGRWSALDATHLFAHAKAGGYVYQAIMRAKTRELMPWIEWGQLDNGMAEMAEHLMNPEMLHAFSTRRAEIEAFVEEYALSARGGAQYATQKTRASKIAVEDTSEWRADIAARAAEWGFDEKTIEALMQLPASKVVDDTTLDQIALRAFGEDGVTAISNVFMHKEMMISYAGSFRQGAGTRLDDYYQATARLMQRPEVVFVAERGTHGQFTTQGLLDTERNFINTAIEGKAAGRARLEYEQITTGIAEYEKLRSATPGSFSLLHGQADVVRNVFRDGNVISHIEALAGSGKTVTAGAMRHVAEMHGYETIGLGPTGRAVRELAGEAGFARPRTLASWDTAFKVNGVEKTLAARVKRPGKAIAFIDEAGMADTRTLSRVTLALSDAGVKVVLIGDSQQLPSVRAGGMLHELTKRLGSYELNDVRRQRDDREIEALQALRDEDPHAYLEYKMRRREEIPAGLDKEARRAYTIDPAMIKPRAADGSLRPDLEVFAGLPEEVEPTAMRQAVDDYLWARETYSEKSTALVTKNNAWRERLNQNIRAELTARGEIIGHRVIGKRNHKELEWAVGDRVIARRNHKGYDVDNGSRGTIANIDKRGNWLDVEWDGDGGRRRLHRKYITDHLEHAYAITGHGGQGATLDWVGVVALPGDFTKEWAYTALSRARMPTNIYLISTYTEAERHRMEFGPVDPPEMLAEEVLAETSLKMVKSDRQDLAIRQAQDEALRRDRIVDANIRTARLTSEAEYEAMLEDAVHGAIDADGGSPLQRAHQEGIAKWTERTSDAGTRQLTPVYDKRLLEHAETRLEIAATRAELESETLQAAITQARQWEYYDEQIRGAQARLAQHGPESMIGLDARRSLAMWQPEHQRLEEALHDPEQILLAAASNEARVRDLETHQRLTREQAVARYVEAGAGFVGALPRPTDRNTDAYGVFQKVADKYAHEVVDAITTPSARLAEDIQRIRVFEAVEIARQEEERKWQADAGVEVDAPTRGARAFEPEAPEITALGIAYSEVITEFRGSSTEEALTAYMRARRDYTSAVIDQQPTWLVERLGPKPDHPALQHVWEAHVSTLADLRLRHGITNELDDGLRSSDTTIAQAIQHYRYDVGLDPAPKWHGIDGGIDFD